MPFWKRLSRSSKRDSSAVVVPPAEKPSAEEETFRKRAQTLFGQGQYETAAFMYGEAVNHDGGIDKPYKAAWYSQIALCHLMSGNNLEALNGIDKVIQLKPQSGEAYRMKGDILERLDDFNGSAAAFTQAVELLSGVEKMQVQLSLDQVRSKAK